MTNKTSKLNKADSKNTASATTKSQGLNIRVHDNDTDLQTEDIILDEDYLLEAHTSPMPTGMRIIDNKGLLKEDPIIPSSSPQDTGRRLQCGLRIVDNRTYQRSTKIIQERLTLPASDELGYKKLFTKFEEAFLCQDLSTLAECLGPSFEWHMPNGDVARGKKECLAEMERKFAMPNGPKFSRSVWEFHEDRVLQTYKVEYMGPDGKWRKSLGFDIYTIADGLITRKDAFWKMIP